MAKQALAKAHEAASQVTDIGTQGIQHASDAFDAVKAAAMDAVHTVGDELSGAVQGLKTGLLTAADSALQIGKAGMTLAQTAIAQGKGAIEMCASQAVAAAKPMVEALGGQLSKGIDAGKGSGDAAGPAHGGAQPAGAQKRPA